MEVGRVRAGPAPPRRGGRRSGRPRRRDARGRRDPDPAARRSSLRRGSRRLARRRAARDRPADPAARGSRRAGRARQGVADGRVRARRRPAAGRRRRSRSSRRSRTRRAAGEERLVARLSASYVMALSEGPTPAPEAIERAEEVLSLRARRSPGRVARAARRSRRSTPCPATSHVRASSPPAAGELLRDLGDTVLAARTSDASARIELMAGDPAARPRRPCGRTTTPSPRWTSGTSARTSQRCSPSRSSSSAGTTTPRSSSRSPTGAREPRRRRGSGAPAVGRARLLAVRGRTVEAQSLGREVVELIRETDAPVLRADTLVDVSEALAAAPDERAAALDEARSLYEQKRHLRRDRARRDRARPACRHRSRAQPT